MREQIKSFEMNELKINAEAVFRQSSPNATEKKSASVILEGPNFIDTDGIVSGICQNCDHRGACVWQHDNKTFCRHFQ